MEGQRDRDLSELKDQLHRERKASSEQQAAALEAQRKVQSLQEGDMLNTDKLREAKDLLAHLKTNSEAERRRWDEEIDGMRRQHIRDMEAQRKDIESRLETERKSVGSRDDQLAKLRQQLNSAEAGLRSTVKELEAEKVAFKIQQKAAKDETERKTELQKLFEKETGLKQDRVEEAHKLSRTLQNTLADKEKEISTLRSDLAHRQKLLEETGKSLKTAEDLAKGQTDRADTMAAEYRQVAELFGAREMLSTTFLATRHIREKLDEHSKTTHALAKAKAEIGTAESKLTSTQIDLDGVKKERDDLKSVVKEKDENLTRVREDLLNATRELRGLMIANEHVLQDKLRCDKTIENGDKKAKEQAKMIEVFEKAKGDTMKIESDAVRKWEAERDALEQSLVDLQASMEAKNECEIQHMVRKLDGLEKENREQNEWVDMCKELGKLWKIDVTNDPACVNKIYRKVEGAVEEAAALKAEHNALEDEQMRTDRLRGGMRGTHRDTGTLALKESQNYLPIVPTLAGGHGGGGGSGGGAPGSKVEYLMAELRRSTESMASTKRHFDDFKESVAKALKFAGRARKVDTTTILARITNLVSRAVAPLDARFDDLLTHPCAIKGKHSKHSSTKPCVSDPKVVKQLETVQKKLRSALETIEAQDMWISVMQAKLGGGEEDTGLKAENHELRSQLDSVRHHLLRDAGVRDEMVGLTSRSTSHRRHPVL
jgi:DNA repair exonuclease SbcCD ATPase subunit